MGLASLSSFIHMINDSVDHIMIASWDRSFPSCSCLGDNVGSYNTESAYKGGTPGSLKTAGGG